MLFVLAYRPDAEPGGGLGVEGNAGFSELALDRMEPDDVAQLVRSKMEQLVGGDAEVSDALVELVAARSEGNPFYVEELLNFIVSQGVDASDPAAIETVRLPESLHTLVLSRIDAAAEGPRRTMKVASVVGRVFEAPMLPGAYEELGDLDAVLGHLDALRTLDLVALDREAEQAWMFKHVVTQEVAYESLPFALRAVLHGRVGDHIERTEADDLERDVPLLEHHYWRSDREDKKVLYLRRAAEPAQASYANQAAIAYYDRLVPLLDGGERVQALLGLGECSSSSATGPGRDTVGEEALGAADALGRSRRPGLGARGARGHRPQAGPASTRPARSSTNAAALFRAAGDDAGARPGAGTSPARVAAQTGRPRSRPARYEESLAIRERLGDRAKMGSLYSNLAIVAEYAGDLDETRAHGRAGARGPRRDRRPLGRRRLAQQPRGDRDPAGRLDEARDATSRRRCALMRQVGDTWFAASAGWLLANVDRDAGDLARGARGLRRQPARSSSRSTTRSPRPRCSRTSRRSRRDRATTARGRACRGGVVVARRARLAACRRRWRRSMREGLAPSVEALGRRGAAAAARGRGSGAGPRRSSWPRRCAQPPTLA